MESGGFTERVLEMCRVRGFEPRTRPDPYPDLGLQAVREGLGVVIYVRGAFPPEVTGSAFVPVEPDETFPFTLAWNVGVRSRIGAGRGGLPSLCRGRTGEPPTPPAAGRRELPRMLPMTPPGLPSALLLAGRAGGRRRLGRLHGGRRLVVAAPDGGEKLALTTDGTPVSPYYAAAQSANGVTVAARQEQFDKMRAVLHAWSAGRRKREAANVMPRNALGTRHVMPLRLDIDAAGKAVAFGYSTCGLGAGCINRTNGYWLTFAQHGPANPSYPRVRPASIALASTATGSSARTRTRSWPRRRSTRRSTTATPAGSIPGGGARFWAAEVRPDGKAIAFEFPPRAGFGLVLAAADGMLGGATESSASSRPRARRRTSPGRRTGRARVADDEGVKVARAPDIVSAAAAEDNACAMGRRRRCSRRPARTRTSAAPTWRR